MMMSSSVSQSIVFVDEGFDNLVSKIWGILKSSGESNDFLKETNCLEIYWKCLVKSWNREMMKSSFKFQIYFEEHIDVFEYYLGEGGGGGGGGGGGRRDAQRHIQNLAKHAR